VNWGNAPGETSFDVIKASQELGFWRTTFVMGSGCRPCGDKLHGTAMGSETPYCDTRPESLL
jgi:hypothetical protein